MKFSKIACVTRSLWTICGVLLSLLSSTAWASPQLLGSSLTLDTGEWQNAVCAHSGTSDTYLVVWVDRASTSATEGNLVAQRINSGTGALVGTQLVLDSTGRAIKPLVGWCRLTNRYLVVWSQMDLGTQADLFARSVDAGTGALSSAGSLTFTLGNSERPLAMSNEVSTVDDELLLIYSTSAAPQTAVLRQVNVPTSGVPTFVGSGTTITTTLDTNSAIAISSQGGQEGRFAVFYPEMVTSSTNDLRIRMFDRNALALGPEVTFMMAAYNRAIDGDGKNFIAVGQYDLSQGATTFGLGLQYDAASGTLIERDFTEYSAVTYFEGYTRLNVAMTGEGAVLAYSHSDFGEDPIIECYTLDGLTGAQLGGAASGGSGLLISGALTGLYRGQTSTEVSDSNTADDLFFLYTELDGDLGARRFAQAGRATDLGGGCGSAGRAVAAGMFVGPSMGVFFSGPWLHLSLESDQPSAPAYALLGMEGNPLACGNCILRVDLGSLLMLPVTTSSSGEGEIAVEIPEVPALTGVSLVTQWLVPSVLPQCPALPAHFSNTLRVIIG
jgi:hypothetical protein